MVLADRAVEAWAGQSAAVEADRMATIVTLADRTAAVEADRMV